MFIDDNCQNGYVHTKRSTIYKYILFKPEMNLSYCDKPLDKEMYYYLVTV